MDLEYDKKFEEMKGYIPFLESMITRLESSCSSSENPRQAQLDKIRSLRDLLLDKKKRMKMENLLKCEQVLVNLYAKVEQRDTLPGIEKASPKFPAKQSKVTSISDLDSARNKLKAIPCTMTTEDPDTFPEIARPSDVEVVCTPGSKLPALFQRRPNKSSPPPAPTIKEEKKSPVKSVPKRNYTRVLVSPEPSPRRWSPDTTSDKPLFSRRSPRRSPKKRSPNRKETKKKRSKDRNVITLKVPEESLNSLNTDDILSRIIECPKEDVDIATLRDLRKQILGELKEEDISDLIMKSYKNKKKIIKPRNAEVEEGELSDSESEAIENIYGSIVLVKEKSNAKQVPSDDKNKNSRKVQIRLRFNPDRDSRLTKQKSVDTKRVEISDFEMVDETSRPSSSAIIPMEETGTEDPNEFILNDFEEKLTVSQQQESQDLITIDVEEDEIIETQKPEEVETQIIETQKPEEVETRKIDESSTVYHNDNNCIDISSSDTDVSPKKNIKSNESFKANFYKPLNVPEVEEQVAETNINSSSPTVTNLTKKISEVVQTENTDKIVISPKKTAPNDNIISNLIPASEPTQESSSTKDTDDIPLLNSKVEPPVHSKTDKDVLSEIDILQALKNEILSESIAIPGSDGTTPLLHQPKLTKVASGQDIVKKRISIENYKKNQAPAQTQSLFVKDPKGRATEEQSKKNSLKLTAQEQERFNFLAASLDDSSDEDDGKSTTVDDIYDDLAPKSPEGEVSYLEPVSPVIIPEDPVKPIADSPKEDVDMRSLMLPVVPLPVPAPNIYVPPEVANDKQADVTRHIDPRLKRDMNKLNESPNQIPPGAMNVDRNSRSSVTYPNMTPNNTRMTPSRMTPSRQSFEFDESSGRKHVYAPFPSFEHRSNDTLLNTETRRDSYLDSIVDDRKSNDSWNDTDLRDRNSWDIRGNRSSRLDHHKSRNDEQYGSAYRNDRFDQRDSYSRLDCPRTPVHPFGRSDCPTTPSHAFGRSDCPPTPNPYIGRSDCPPTPNPYIGRSECPLTPNHPFGRTECPPTPNPYIGRSECPQTPNHPFGRTECPPTPNPYIGRSECPPTPNHPFGRTDCPPTPNPYIGRSECPSTPSHPYGRTDCPTTPNPYIGRSECPPTPSHSYPWNDCPPTPNHSFVRSDSQVRNVGMKPFEYPSNQQNSRPKDPRLNRNRNFDSNTQKYDRGSYKNNRVDYSRNAVDNKEYYRNDQWNRDNNRYNRERTPGREASVGCSQPQNYERDRLYTRDRNTSEHHDYRRENNPRNFNDVGSRRYDRAQSAGRTIHTEDYRHSRAPSIDMRTNRDNSASVKQQSGRSFTIDTSVNSTFQQFLNEKGLQVFDYSFDSRRSRAASVGRSLAPEPHIERKSREGSVGRALVNQLSTSGDTSAYKKMVNFVRARSMGRDLKDDRRNRTLKEIKADFESYRDSYKVKVSKKQAESQSYINVNRNDLRGKKNDPQFDRKISSNKQNSYSPRKNCRDPRMRRDQFESKNKNRYEDKRKSHGIVYSNDNIAKGTILGSGYGVKNYKIPKIKRPEPEKPKEEPKPVVDDKRTNVEKNKNTTTIKTKHADKKGKESEPNTKNDTKKGTKTEKKKTEIPEKTKSVIDSKNKKNTGLEKDVSVKDTKESIVRTRKIRKPISDSDSDSDQLVQKKSQVTDAHVTQSTEKLKSSETPKSNENNLNSEIEKPVDSSFGMDDTEIFSENIASDPVLANINALIADLDQEIDSTKTDDLSDNISLSNIFGSTDNPEKAITETLNDISEVIQRDLTSAELPKPEVKLPEDVPNHTKKVEQSLDTSVESAKKDGDALLTLSSPDKDKIRNSNIQIITENEIPLAQESDENVTKNNEPTAEDNVGRNINSKADAAVTTAEDKNESSKKKQGHDEERCSTPDSTINTNILNKTHTEDGLADSTDKSESHFDVSSSHEISANLEQEKPSSSQPKSSTDSIGSLLSILQDKSKIKELLTMLGDNSSENEKIKKKLEKLSAIVSDDEDSNDGITKDGAPQDVVTPEPQVHHDADLSVDGVNSDTNIECNVPKTRSPQIKQKKTNITKTKKKKMNKVVPKRVTRSGTTIAAATKKKPSRELKQLQESIKEMFSSDDILNNSGIRMCRLAKMVEDKNQEEENQLNADPKPVVVLEKCKDQAISPEPVKTRKKPGPKLRKKQIDTEVLENDVKLLQDTSKDIKLDAAPKYRPGPKSKKTIKEPPSDPYSFDDSVSESTTGPLSEHYSSDSESDSLASSQSIGSSDVLADVKKKPKRKRRYGWQSGFIKPNKKRKKVDTKQTDTSVAIVAKPDGKLSTPEEKIDKLDFNCFTDKTYCFDKNITDYACRFCLFKGSDIVKHYRDEHPHTEVPLSRMNTETARTAIEQCEDANFKAVCEMSTDKYICRFCFKVFANKRNVLETFFWHVVSTHTGEYKQTCSECVTATRCPFNLDIPPPPKDVKGQLIGYICGKCNFTQISLENLKTHVIVRHNDERTAVYTINLAAMSKVTINTLISRSTDKARVLRSSRTNAYNTDTSDTSDIGNLTESSDHFKEAETAENTLEKEDIPKSQNKTKMSFESDDNVEIKTEGDGGVSDGEDKYSNEAPATSVDIMDCTHFKIHYGESGTKEYVCCINGNDNHYKTALLISMKKHVQTKHSELWDGYCSLCKVITMPQGDHRFKECLQHMLDKHIDEFPTIELADKESKTEVFTHTVGNTLETEFMERTASPKISVRPLSNLLAPGVANEDPDTLPKIESVISLGIPTAETTQDSGHIVEPNTSTTFKCPAPPEKPLPAPEEPYRYEEWQREIMSKKHSVVLDGMMKPEKLVQIFKCAGRYCSFTTDSAEAAVLHASKHQSIGGDNALTCAYCDFDCDGNSIGLVTHVFKKHGRCQYVCTHCFYRAAASQLVLAHGNRVHGFNDHQSRVVLETATASPLSEESVEMLPREVTAQHYACYDPIKLSCRYKTYTPGKFIHHLMGKHTAPLYCYICKSQFDNSTDLLQHMKVHGLKLYQCTWCLNGGDNEPDFLMHCSYQHPNREPQAYLRVITTTTNSDGTSRTMVLPLVKLNKNSVVTRLVTPIASTEDPANEAERALDFEKIMKSMPLLKNQLSKEPVLPAVNPPTHHVLAGDALLTPTEALQPHTTPPRTTSGTPPADVTLQLTQTIKTEPTEVQNDTSNASIICLDSDDEETDRNEQVEVNKPEVIDLSDDEQPLAVDKNKTNVEYSVELFKCQNCSYCFKKAGFRHHLNFCSQKDQLMKCANCEFNTKNLDSLYYHYKCCHDKSNKESMFMCAICQHKSTILVEIVTHLRREHKLNTYSVTQENNIFVLNEVVKRGQKRKIPTSKTAEVVPKRMCYGAEDLHKLPQKPILDELAYCSECEFKTKVRLNLVRHIQQHAQNLAVPQTAPVNPVPHLQTNEKHFDRMINLASSSFEISRPEKPSSVTTHVPPEAASRYPKYVSDRQRHACGAKGCSYISVDEAMLKCHWETLHSGSNDFHCVHCPPYQHLDTSKPLTASRITAHLKMHDTPLYACASCPYYHYRKQMVEKHLAEVHKGAAQMMIVREEGSIAPAAPAPALSSGAPTMDLKPWKCGVCAFKSMLRPEVIDHCFNAHNTKMQFKCPACPFRASSLENVTKHLSNSHPDCNEEVFHFYYREGCLPDEADGTPRWVKQRQMLGNPEPEIKLETTDGTQQAPTDPKPVLPTTPVNLDLVKKEVESGMEQTMEGLCRRFGPLCEPNGLKYKCPLCQSVNEDSMELMQSHLYEELQYRKWGCSLCSYKAFHKTGLNEHQIIEHRQHRAIEPIQLPIDSDIERWVTHVLETQTKAIEANKIKFEKQKLQIPRTAPTNIQILQKPANNETEYDTDVLIQNFGSFGESSNGLYCCPKCGYQVAEKEKIKEHLEIELNKIRWRCSLCPVSSQNYHEAQLHSKTCKSSAPGQISRPMEAMRDPASRAAWVAAVMRSQKPDNNKLQTTPEKPSGSVDNSLLVVRYEERVPAPEELMMNQRKRPAPGDSDDERLVIDELSDDEHTPRKKNYKKCEICSWTTRYPQCLEQHVLRHYGLKSHTCGYCGVTVQKPTSPQAVSHMKKCHAGLADNFTKTVKPTGPPKFYDLPKLGRKRSTSKDSPPSDKKSDMHQRKEPLRVPNEEIKKLSQEDDTKKEEVQKMICLTCEKSIPMNETDKHLHDKPAQYAMKGDVVVKCCICLSLFLNRNCIKEHTLQAHPNKSINYAFYKLCYDSREIHTCGYCKKRFKYFADFRSHHNAVHSSQQVKFDTKPYTPGDYMGDNEDKNDTCREDEIVASTSTNKVAKKSTTKLPSQTIAKKSTTKLPTSVPEPDDEYSYYGMKPSALTELNNVTANMPFNNTMTSFTVKQLNEIMNINPVVVVKTKEDSEKDK